MYFPFRYSRKIEKQILWILLFLKFGLKKYMNVLDVGCGTAKNLKMFRFKNYHGIDIDRNRIESNKKNFKNKNITFKESNITSTDYSITKKYDLVIMIQVMTNNLFDDNGLCDSILNLINSSSELIIFNTSKSNNSQLKTIDNFLISNNVIFKKYNYGIPSFLKKIEAPLLSQLIAIIFVLILIFINNFFNKNKTLYVCKKNL